VKRSQNLIEIRNNFPTCVLALSKSENGIRYVVVFDKRPESLSLTIKHVKDIVYIVTPYNFSPNIVFRHQYWNKFFDITMLGNIELNQDNNVENVRLFLCSKVLELKQRKERIINSLSRVNSTVRDLSKSPQPQPYQLISSVSNIINSCYLGIPDLYLDLGETIFQRQIPEMLKSSLRKYLTTGKKNILVNTLKEISNANKDLNENDNLFFHIVENDDYDDVILSLLKFCRKEIDFLRKYCHLFFWYNQKDKRIVMKILNYKQKNKQLSSALKNIDHYLKDNFNKGLLNLPLINNLLINEEYNTKNILTQSLEEEIFILGSEFILRNKITWNQRTGIEIYLKVASGLVLKMKECLRKEFLNYLYFTTFYEKSANRKRIKYFFAYEKEITTIKARQADQHKSFVIWNNINEGQNNSTTKKTSTQSGSLTVLGNKFFKKMNTYCKSRSFELIINNRLDFYVYNSSVTKTDVFMFNQLRTLLEKTAANLALKDENVAFCNYVMLENN